MDNSDERAFYAVLEKTRVPEDMRARAYERTPARMRALVKSGVALAHFHFGSSDSKGESFRENRGLGFWRQRKTRPADLACLFFGADECAAARIAAAAILPRLALVDEVLAFCVGAEPSGPLLASLELCGVEDIFLMGERECRDLLSILPRPKICRVCFLRDGSLDGIYSRAVELEIAVADLPGRPDLLVLNPEAFDLESLEFCQGDAIKAGACASPDCVYAARPENADIPARLKLGPGCEGFWLFDGLGLDFYQTRESSFGKAGR